MFKYKSGNLYIPELKKKIKQIFSIKFTYLSLFTSGFMSHVNIRNCLYFKQYLCFNVTYTYRLYLKPQISGRHLYSPVYFCHRNNLRMSNSTKHHPVLVSSGYRQKSTFHLLLWWYLVRKCPLLCHSFPRLIWRGRQTI